MLSFFVVLRNLDETLGVFGPARTGFVATWALTAILASMGLELVVVLSVLALPAPWRYALSSYDGGTVLVAVTPIARWWPLVATMLSHG